MATGSRKQQWKRIIKYGSLLAGAYIKMYICADILLFSILELANDFAWIELNKICVNQYFAIHKITQVLLYNTIDILKCW